MLFDLAEFEYCFEMFQRFNRSASQKLHQEFPKLHKRFGGHHFWAFGYSAWNTGIITVKMVNDRREHQTKNWTSIIIEFRAVKSGAGSYSFL